MNAEEFVKELLKIRTSFDWKATPDVKWAAERRAKPRLHIRATSRDLVGGVLFDPIGALCYVLAGQAFGAESWAEAARAIQLDEEHAWLIMAASNDLTWRLTGDQRRLYQEIVAIRSDIAAAVGLETHIPDCEQGFVRLCSSSGRIPHPSHSRDVLELVASLDELACISAWRRLEGFLKWLNESVELEAFSEDGRLLLPFKRKDLAAAIKITPEHLSRLLSQLQREGILELRDQWIIVRNHRALRESA
jgi:hypothetical protein